MKKYICSMVLVITVGMQAAFADVTVVYKMISPNGNGTQTIRYADNKHVRVDMTSAINHELTMMKLGKKVYMISGKVVQDLQQLAKMMAMMGKGVKKSSTEHSPIKYEDTGKTETVAGITGKVYRYLEKGKRHEVVLAKNKDLQAATKGFVEIIKASIGVLPNSPMDRVQQDATIKSMAMLRLDDRLILKSINTDAIKDSVFVLPAKPQQFGPFSG